jgi:hypothetical protein
MIGLVVQPHERRAVAEFFELFKTPWEFARRNCSYDVVLITTGETAPQANLILRYSSHPHPSDLAQQLTVTAQGIGTHMCWEDVQIPLYGARGQVTGPGRLLATDAKGAPLARSTGGIPLTIRIGYDLFIEVEHLLTKGQPPADASTPTLDRHVEFVRQLVIQSGHTLVEIPPVPEGHTCIGCLTHDVDNPMLRAHRFDGTTVGFLTRALLKTPFDALRGRASLAKMISNARAALQLPFVHAGAMPDVWSQFPQYLTLAIPALRATAGDPPRSVVPPPTFLST